MVYVKRSFVSRNHVSAVFICNQRVRETWVGWWKERGKRGWRGCSCSALLLGRPFSARATIVDTRRILGGVLRDFRRESCASAWRVRYRSHNKSDIVCCIAKTVIYNQRIISMEKLTFTLNHRSDNLQKLFQLIENLTSPKLY